MTKKNAKKRAARARQEAHGGKYQAELRQVGGARSLSIKLGRYAGRPNLPKGPTTHWCDGEGRLLPDSASRPQVEWVDIQGEFDPDDLNKAWVPATAFDDPSMPRDPSGPPDVKRALTLAEYIDARGRQTGWRLERVEAGSLVFMGTLLNVVLHWDPRTALPGARS